MDKRPIALAEIYHLLNPGPVVLVSVEHGGRDNLFPVSWVMPACDDPPVAALLVAREHFSFPLLEASGELGLNLPTLPILDAVYGCGKTSGREVPDKFARFGLHRERATTITAPLVAECVAGIECRVDRIHDVEGSALILARAVAARAAPDCFRDGEWRFEAGLVLCHHLNGARFCLSERAVTARRP